MSSSYLDRIRFDKKLAESRIAKYLGNIRLVALLIVVIVFAGIVGYTSLPRRLNPEINLPIVSVITVLPGASPTDVESLVTIPIENKLQSVENLDTITSVSRDNVSAITLQFTGSTPPEVAKADVQDIVDSVTNLPEDAETPSVSALDFENQPVWTFTLQSTSSDTTSLMQFSKSLQKELEEDSTISTVSLSGWQEEEVLILVKEETYSRIGLNPILLSQTIRNALSSFPAGTVETKRNAFSVTIDPTIVSVGDLRNLPIQINGKVIQLSDIAEIRLASKPNQGKALIAKDGQIAQTVTFNVFKSDSSKIDVAQKNAENIVEEKLSNHSDEYILTTITNVAEEITDQFNDLLDEFGTTMILVFGVIFIFLGLRQAAISIITVPLTFAAAFFIMSQIGMSINFLSLFALLLTLGLLVDDTIVVISAMTTYYKTKRFNPYETGLLVWRDTIVPIWSTTITTIWSFVPLLLASGIIGSFIKPIPIVVSVTMISSTAIAVLVTLPIMIVLLKPMIAKRVYVLLKILVVVLGAAGIAVGLSGNKLLLAALVAYAVFVIVLLFVAPALFSSLKTHFKKSKKGKSLTKFMSRFTGKGLIDFERVEKAYYNFSMRILSSKGARRRATFAIIIYSLIGFALIPLGFVKTEFFPKTPAEQVYINLEMPSGTNSEITEREAREILTQLSLTEGVDEVTTTVGQSFSDNGEGTQGTNLATFTLRLPALNEQKRDSIEIAQDLRDSFEAYTEGEVSVIELSGGPPAGADIQITILGDELEKLDEFAQKLATNIETLPGVTNIETSLKKGTSTLVFMPNSEKLAELGISVSDIGFAIRTYTSGFTLDSTTFENTDSEEIDITLRLANISDINALNTIPVQTSKGPIAISTLGEFVPQTGITTIVREGGKRRVNVTAAVLPGFSATELNPKVVELAEKLELPEGYSWTTGGVNQENEESVQSIIYAMGAAALLILVTMVIQFNSFRQAIVVLMVIPLAVSSVFWAFALTGIPLSFPALIGVLSLFGIVVTNSMFIVDKINLNRREGMPFKEAIADAGSSRLEPIILTKLCTVFGLLPITLSDPLWRGLGGAIISGLLISSTIMLLFIPSVYYGWFQGSRDKGK